MQPTTYPAGVHREHQGHNTVLALPLRPVELLSPRAHLCIFLFSVWCFWGALITGVIVASDLASGQMPSECVIACPVFFYLWRWIRGITRRFFKTEDEISWDTRHLFSGPAAPELALDEVTLLTVRPVHSIPLEALLRPLGIPGRIAAWFCKPLRWSFLADTPAEPHLRKLAESGVLIARTAQREQILTWGHGLLWLEQLAESLSNDHQDLPFTPFSIENKSLSAA